MFPHANPQMLSEETQSTMLNRTLERNSRPSLCRAATASPVSAALLFQPGSALQSVFFLSSWAKYILQLSLHKKFWTLLWLFRHYNMLLHCLMHEPTLKSSQSWSIKSLLQWLLKCYMWIKNWWCCWGRVGNLLMLQCCDAVRFYWKNSRAEENINHGAERKQYAFQQFTFGCILYILFKHHKQDLAARMGYLHFFPTYSLILQNGRHSPSLIHWYYLKSLSPALFHFLPSCTVSRCCPEQSFLPAAPLGRKFSTVHLLPRAVHLRNLLLRR